MMERLFTIVVAFGVSGGEFRLLIVAETDLNSQLD